MKKIDKSILSKVIKVRNTESYKGNYGRILIIAGSIPFGGAAILSASAAVHTGAGLVTVATTPEKFTSLNTEIPEAMTIDYHNSQELTEVIIKNNVIVVGPGLGISDVTNNIIQLIINNSDKSKTIIMDASALTFVAEKNIDLSSIKNLILTPHQGEWQRLSNLSIPNQSVKNNLKAINELAPNATLIVKKHLSEVYYQDKVSQIQVGNAGMATGGMGDTLSGILAGFVGQFGNSLETIQAGLFLHSYIADKIYENNYVVLPSNLITKIPKYMKKFSNTSNSNK